MGMVMRFRITGMLIVLIVMMAGCTSGNLTSEQNNRSQAKTDEKLSNSEPVTLNLFRVTKESFEPAWEALAKKKHPNITLNFMEVKASQWKSQIASDALPDIIYQFFPANVNGYIDLGMGYNMNQLAKQANFDFSRLEPAWMDMFKADLDGKPTLIGIPYAIGFGVMYYNKDIFDKFGVSYPKDGMTWEDTIELSKKLSRTEGGVQYQGIGFQPEPTDFIATQLSLPLLNAKTGKANLYTDPWKRAVALSKSLFDVSGFTDEKYRSAKNDFTKDKTLAMLIATNVIKSLDEINWDMVTMPVFKEKPTISRGPSGHGVVVTSTSKHKKEAFLIASLLFSDEMQKAVSQSGKPGILKNSEIKQEFINSFPNLQGKNAMAIFKDQPAPWAPITEYDTVVKKELITSLDEIMLGNKDVNTGLREADERGNLAIWAAAGK
jgi:multiple sugar transport system substrate-binding protein